MDWRDYISMTGLDEVSGLGSQGRRGLVDLARRWARRILFAAQVPGAFGSGNGGCQFVSRGRELVDGVGEKAGVVMKGIDCFRPMCTFF